jgi:hypothetical protein
MSLIAVRHQSNDQKALLRSKEKNENLDCWLSWDGWISRDQPLD